MSGYMCPKHGVKFLAPPGSGGGVYFVSSSARDRDAWEQFVAEMKAHRVAKNCDTEFEIAW